MYERQICKPVGYLNSQEDKEQGEPPKNCSFKAEDEKKRQLRNQLPQTATSVTLIHSRTEIGQLTKYGVVRYVCTCKPVYESAYTGS